MTQPKTHIFSILAVAAIFTLCGAPAVRAQAAPEKAKGMQGKVKLMTLDPGHFHASLVQKKMYEQVDPVVHVYSPGGDDLAEHLKKVDVFNKRAEAPTKWDEQVYTGPDFFEKMIKEKPGNVVVLAGNNAKKAEYISGCIKAGLNVLSDKPMAVVPQDLTLIKAAFKEAKKQGVLLYDIMTERSEISTMMQKELSLDKALFGALVKGTPEAPAVSKESVHHYCKVVAGSPLKRPGWFYDVAQQGEGIVDVTTHLVDLIQWECFPEQIINGPKDVKMLAAKRWTTTISPEQFKKSTSLEQFPDYLKKDVKDGVLNVYANGEFTYSIKGHVAKVSVVWNFEAPAGGGDMHYSIMRGSKANLVIKQGKEQGYKPTLYVENTTKATAEEFEKTLKAAIEKVNAKYPGMEVKKGEGNWEIVIPEKYKVGHEAHFGQVADRYLDYLAKGALPKWEEPNMIAKYYTTMEAYKMSR